VSRRRYKLVNSSAGIAAAEVNDLSLSVTWANVPDANITESSVTQHAAAIASAAGALLNVVEDTTPQLGGSLDTNNFDINFLDGNLATFGTGNDVSIRWTGSEMRITAGASGHVWAFRDGPAIRFYDAGDTDYGQFQHDGTDFNFTFVNTTEVNFDTLINMADNEVKRAVFEDYGIENNTASSSSGTVTLDITTGNSFETTLTENITTVTISNPSASGTYCEIIWKIVQDTVARTVTFPAAVNWQGGTAPTISTGSGAVDIIVLRTWDGGTSWYGDFGQDYS
jgi:hypothetical protein